MENEIIDFEDYEIRRHYDEEHDTWYFSVIDILRVLIQQPDFLKARKYWNKLKERLKKEGSEVVTNCHQLGWGKRYALPDTNYSANNNFRPPLCK